MLCSIFAKLLVDEVDDELGFQRVNSGARAVRGSRYSQYKGR
jgi:hypothetical protein